MMTASTHEEDEEAATTKETIKLISPGIMRELYLPVKGLSKCQVINILNFNETGLTSHSAAQ